MRLMQYDIDKLIRARLLKGWNKAKLAKKIKVTPRVIADVERGFNSSPQTITKMADALGVPREEVVI